MRHFGKAVALSLAFLGNANGLRNATKADESQALKVTILADSNRDGTVDVDGQTDHVAGKETWTRESGALFMANIGDSGGRCASKAAKQSTAEVDLDKCHDADDDVLRNPRYITALRTVASPNLGDSATGSVDVLNETVASLVRIFHKQGQNWVYVASNHTFSAQDLKAGLHLGIDARDVRRPGVWDGRATVQFTVRDGAQEASDKVALRVAPILTQHNGQAVEKLIVSPALLRTNPPLIDWPQNEFVKALTAAAEQAGITDPVMQLKREARFAQDFFESGFMSIPGPDGPVSMRVLIRDAQGLIDSGSQMFDLRSETLGVVQYVLRKGLHTDGLGNLETIPPHTHDGKFWPAGRAVMGSQGKVRPHMMTFLEAQEDQMPIEVDTSWLNIGHVDEFMQFLAADNERGWVMVVSDPRTALELLGNAVKDGHGKNNIFSRPNFITDSGRFCAWHFTLESMYEVLSPSWSNHHYAMAAIEKNIAIIEQETGITDDDIIRVPALYSQYRSYSTECEGIKRVRPPANPLERRAGQVKQLEAMLPSAVNNVVLGKGRIVAARSWGPVINGKDIFAQNITAAYAKANYSVTFIDDWSALYVYGGDVHCGSNALRQLSPKW